MSSKSQEKKTKYELQPPDGGWGYFVTAAVAITGTSTVVPMCIFGLIFGNFLASVGDETTGTALSTGIFGACLYFTGFATNILLLRYSYRAVAGFGALTFFVGSFSTTFVTSLPQMVFSFGVVQGVGMGLMYPALFSSLNSYFHKRLSLVNSIAQGTMVAGSIAYPYIGNCLLDAYGFRGTQALVAALSLHAFPAFLVLHPVQWHMKKKWILPESEDLLEGGEPVTLKPRTSIVSAKSLSLNTGKQSNAGKSFMKALNLELLKDLGYVNVALGLALGFTADVSFISIIPMVLLGAGLSADQTAILISVFFGADLIARFLLGVLSAFYHLRNRYIFLGASFLQVLLRTAFVLRNDFYWKLVTVGSLGFTRCFIQTPLPVVLAEQYRDNFSTAFSLYMVVGGFVALLFGPLMSLVKSWSHSDVMVVHLLSLANLICVVSWSIELLCKRKRTS